MRKIISVVFILFIVFVNVSLVNSAYHIKDINRFVDIHYFNNQIEENIDYWGVFQNYHFYINHSTNDIYLFDIASMKLSKTIKLQLPNDYARFKKIRYITFYNNNLWVVDQRNRVAFFEYYSNTFKFKGLFHLTGIELVYKIKATSKGLYGFGKNYKNDYLLIQYSHFGSRKDKIKDFGNKVRGNIVLSQDENGNLLYGFSYFSKIFYLKDNPKTYTLTSEIKYEENNRSGRKNGILYNIAVVDNFLIATYWTVENGGLLEIYNKKTKELAVTASYPIGKGLVNEEGIFIYRTSFQDNKMRSFIMELDFSKILNYLDK